MQPDVLLDAEDGRFTRVEPGAAPGEGARRLAGVTVPGLVNAHSHAFHRALRARTHGDRGDFWTWRERMYAVASRLDPDRYHALARACFAEMALAGITAVGEFHYLHHGPGGVPYDDPNAMAEAVRAAAHEAGVRLTLLDALYLQAHVDGRPLDAVPRRFSDGDPDRWAGRVEALAGAWAGDPTARVGVAVHSVRAVDRASMAVAAAFAGRSRPALPLHVHVSEQPAENAACQAVHGCSPVAVLADAGVLGPASTAVHATHVTAADLDRLATTGSAVCLCPTTERDLADGIGPARSMAALGIPLALGSDSHAVIDPFEEARAVELDERLASGTRGGLAPAELLTAATATGADRLGWPDAGRLAVGQRADFATVGLDSVRLAGAGGRADAGSGRRRGRGTGAAAGLDAGARPADPADASVAATGTTPTADLAAAVVFAATAADVTDVVVDGRPVVAAGHHLLIDDVPRALAAAIGGVHEGAG
jgi:formiminoglutamate deiminase